MADYCGLPPISFNYSVLLRITPDYPEVPRISPICFDYSDFVRITRITVDYFVLSRITVDYPGLLWITLDYADYAWLPVRITKWSSRLLELFPPRNLVTRIILRFGSLKILLQFRNSMINFIRILLQFGSFKIYFMKIN